MTVRATATRDLREGIGSRFYRMGDRTGTEAGEAAQQELLERRFEEMDLLVIYIDGMVFGAHHVIDDNQTLLVFDMSTRKWRRVADKLGTIGYITWSPDSGYIGFDNLWTEDPGFYRVRVADCHVERLISLKDIFRFFDIFGPWSGMAPDGSPLLVRDISTQEIYALDVQ